MTLKLKIIGRKTFDSKIDITDPCYNRDVWCRMNDIEIMPGEYDCYVYVDEEGTPFFCGISHVANLMDIDNDRFDTIGEIGVDAGLAGFFNHKPDYNDTEWSEFCDKCDGNTSAYMFDEGFFSCSGDGDGCYDVSAIKDENGRIIALEINFLGDDFEIEDEDEDYA